MVDDTADARILLNIFSVAYSENSHDWKPLRTGVDIALLYGGGGAADAPAAALLRYAAGASVPLHEHCGYEHILILRGSQSDEHGSYGTGELIISPPGTRHSVTSKDGCMVLAIWEKPVRFV
ncbi:MAG: cupin domain-containing protein [Gammaproteobacteria bacterium]|nr:cupin domain-containing protein [Gammaproteobacteria bacterium]